MTDDKEREAVVRWLRDDVAWHRAQSGKEILSLKTRLAHEETANILDGHADAIERGEHRKDTHNG